MKTVIYRFKDLEEEAGKKLYVNFFIYLLKIASRVKDLYDWDFVAYPTDFDLFLRKKRICLSCFEAGIRTLNKIDEKFEKMIKNLKIEYKRTIKTRKERK